MTTLTISPALTALPTRPTDQSQDRELAGLLRQLQAEVSVRDEVRPPVGRQADQLR